MKQSVAENGSRANPPPETGWVDYYALLGLPPFEPDTAKILDRARAMIRETRKYHSGPQAAQAQLRLDALGDATVRLLDPQLKRAYDDELRERFDLPLVAVASTYSVPPIRVREAGLRGTAPATAGRTALSAALTLALVAGAVLLYGSHRADNGPSRTLARPPGGVPHAIARAAPAAALAPPPAAAEPVARPPGREGQETLQVELLPTAHELPEDSDATADDENEDPLPDAHEVEPAGAPIPPAPAVAPAQSPMPPRRSPAAVAKAPVARQAEAEPELKLSSAAVLAQLKRLRLRSAGGPQLLTDPQLTGWSRAAQLVRYARRKFADDRRFQRQLDGEVASLKRLWPQIVEALPEER